MPKCMKSVPVGEKFKAEFFAPSQFFEHFTHENTDFAPIQFQRMFRTSPVKQQQIIKAIIEGEMSQTFHFRKKYDPITQTFTYECLDGLQRSMIMYMFFQGQLLAPPLTIYERGRLFETTRPMKYDELLNHHNNDIFREAVEKVQNVIVIVYNVAMTDGEAIEKFGQLNNNTPITRPEMREGFNSYISNWVRHKATWGEEFGGRLKLFNYDITREKVFKYVKGKKAHEGNFDLLERHNKKTPIHAIQANRKKNIQDYLGEMVFYEYNLQNANDPFSHNATPNALDELFNNYDFRYSNDGEVNEFAEKNGSQITNKVQERADWVYKLLWAKPFQAFAPNLEWTAIRMLYLMTYKLESMFDQTLSEIRVDSKKFAHKFCDYHFTQLEEGRKAKKAGKPIPEYVYLLGRASPHEMHRKLELLTQGMGLFDNPEDAGITVKDTVRKFDKLSVSNRYYRVDGRCEYCNKKISRHEAHGDHAIPHSKGGKTTPENLVIACATCNGEKGSLSKDEYMAVLEQRANGVLNYVN